MFSEPLSADSAGSGCEPCRASKDGRLQQSSFADYPVMRMREAPKVDVHVVESSEHPGGIGEPGALPIAPAVANAVFTLTKKRVRELPSHPVPCCLASSRRSGRASRRTNVAADKRSDDCHGLAKRLIKPTCKLNRTFNRQHD
jgi:hypothetical protein